MSRARIAVLVSGGGTNLQALIDAEKKGIIKSGKIELVISNKEGAYALERAKKADIETAVVSKKQLGSQAAFEAEIIKLLDLKKIDIIVLAGKGHETYQEINHIKHHMDEREIVNEYFVGR